MKRSLTKEGGFSKKVNATDICRAVRRIVISLLEDYYDKQYSRKNNGPVVVRYSTVTGSLDISATWTREDRSSPPKMCDSRTSFLVFVSQQEVEYFITIHPIVWKIVSPIYKERQLTRRLGTALIKHYIQAFVNPSKLILSDEEYERRIGKVIIECKSSDAIFKNDDRYDCKIAYEGCRIFTDEYFSSR